MVRGVRSRTQQVTLLVWAGVWSWWNRISLGVMSLPKSAVTKQLQPAIWSYRASIDKIFMYIMGQKEWKNVWNSFFLYPLHVGLYHRHLDMCKQTFQRKKTAPFYRFYVLSTVFQSYQDNERMIMKGCVQWNRVYGREDFASSGARNWDARLGSYRLTHLATVAPKETL